MIARVRSKMFYGIFGAVVLFVPSVPAQLSFIDSGIVTLEARRKSKEKDNYTRAAFSFRFGLNGDEAVSVTMNNWDILFGNSTHEDSFDVTTVTDDRSRIKDLGKREWSDFIDTPELPCFDEPKRERAVAAVIGHLYLVHSCDRDSDHVSLFRVEELISKQSVTISWRLLSFAPKAEAK